MLGQPVSMLIPQVVGFGSPAKLGRLDRDRPGADRHRDAAQEGRGRQVRRVLRAWRRELAARRPRHDCATWRRNTARPAASSRSTPETLEYLRLTGPLEAEHVELVEAYMQRAGPVPHAEMRRARVQRHARARARDRRAEHRRAGAGRRIACCCARRVGVPGGAAVAAGERGAGAARQGAAVRMPTAQRDVGVWGEGDSGSLAVARRSDSCQQPDARRGRDRRDHELHEHEQSVGDARCRIAGEERGRARPRAQALGEDARLRPARASSPTTTRAPGWRRFSTGSASRPSATVAPPASATPARSPRTFPRRSSSAAWSSRRCSRATAISKAASIWRRCARTS